MLNINQTTPDLIIFLLVRFCEQMRKRGQTANQDFLMDRDRLIGQSD